MGPRQIIFQDLQKSCNSSERVPEHRGQVRDDLPFLAQFQKSSLSCLRRRKLDDPVRKEKVGLGQPQVKVRLEFGQVSVRIGQSQPYVKFGLIWVKEGYVRVRLGFNQVRLALDYEKLGQCFDAEKDNYIPRNLM